MMFIEVDLRSEARLAESFSPEHQPLSQVSVFNITSIINITNPNPNPNPNININTNTNTNINININNGISFCSSSIKGGDFG